MFENKMYNCPNCHKKKFHLTEDWTHSKCDKCGFEVDYSKMPIFKDLTSLVKSFRDAVKFPIDANDLEEEKEE